MTSKICICRPLFFQLGFDAAVAAIGLKANVSEAEHPLLCEGTRRQRGDLALLLLVHYKDQPARSETCRELSLSYEAISWVHLAFRGIMKIFLLWWHLVVKE